jgi:hypothetical protein
MSLALVVLEVRKLNKSIAQAMRLLEREIESREREGLMNESFESQRKEEYRMVLLPTVTPAENFRKDAAMVAPWCQSQQLWTNATMSLSVGS